MIRIRDLSMSYAGREVLTEISADFPAGEFTALIGPNGAGKSTLLGLLARLAQPDRGRIELGAADTARIPVADYARKVALLRQAQDPGLRLSVEELVGYGRFPWSRGRLTGDDHRAIDRAIEFLSLNALRRARIDEISGGQRQLAWLAMTIAQETPCLLLDEPLNNLDMRHAVQIMQALRALCKDHGRTVIAVIHDINFAANYADRILAMKAGRIAAEGTVAEVVTEAGLAALYGLGFEILPTARGFVCNYYTPGNDPIPQGDRP